MRIGQALKSKANETYLRVDYKTTIEVTDKEGNLVRTVVIPKGGALFLSKPADDVDFLVEKGKLTSAQGEERKAKIPDFVLYNIKAQGEKTENSERF